MIDTNITAPVAVFNPADITRLRTTLWNAGYRPVVLYSNDKRPYGDNWTVRARLTPPEAVTVVPHPELANTGILADGLRFVDIDVDDAGRAEEVLRLARTMLGAAPIRTRDGSPRVTLLYRAAEGEPTHRGVSNKLAGPIGADGKPVGEKVEVLGRGQQCMANGTHPSGKPVQWQGICPRADLTPVTEETIGVFLEAAAKTINATDAHGGDGWSGGYYPPAEMLACGDRFLLERIVNAMPNTDDARTAWIKFAHAVAAAFVLDPWRGRAAFVAYSTRWDGPTEEGEAERVYDSIGSQHQVGAGHLVDWAEARGVDSKLITDYKDDLYQRAQAFAQNAFDGEERPADATEPESRAYPGGMAPDFDYDDAGPGPAPRGSEHSDATVAQHFIREHGDNLRYVAAWGSWLFWNGRQWEKNSTAKVRNVCRMFLQEYTAKFGAGPTPWTKGEINSMMSSHKVKSVLELASADRRIASTVDAWDADDWLLGTPGGYVDLRTGVLHPADRSLLMSKTTAAAPGGDCPKWRKFISDITGGSEGLQEYIQRFLGYCLTGLNTEHVFHFGHGPGGNGKNVLLDTFTAVMGDYAISVPAEIFVVSQHDRHPTEVAMMAGARVVIGQEVPTGRKWNITRIKEWSGANANTKIRARFMNKDFFEFTPKGKLFLTGNDRPELEKVDNAIRRRLRLLPFIVTIEDKDMILDLAEQLEAEFSGILAWQIAGLKEWQRIGLAPPEVVTKASTEYLDSQDKVQNWIEERCEIGAGHSAGSTALYDDFREWSGYPKDGMSQKKFVTELAEKRYQTRKAAVRMIDGLRLQQVGKPAEGNPNDFHYEDTSDNKPANGLFH